MDVKNSKQLLEQVESYNSYGDFRKQLGFVDIETTGLDFNTHEITMVGVYSKKKPRVYIRGKDLDNAKQDVEDHSYVVSYNGNRFDLPFMEKKLGLERKFDSIDLMYLLWEIGYKGGLKSIEGQLGIVRDKTVVGMEGKDALRLWANYENGCNDSLEKLIKYNQEDIINLEVLLNFVYYRALKYPVGTRHIGLWREEILNSCQNSPL